MAGLGSLGSYGQRSFPLGKNDKGKQICYRCGSTKHLAFNHGKESEEAADKKDKSAAESKDIPTVKVIKAGGRKKGQDRVAERVWELTDSENK